MLNGGGAWDDGDEISDESLGDADADEELAASHNSSSGGGSSGGIYDHHYHGGGAGGGRATEPGGVGLVPAGGAAPAEHHGAGGAGVGVHGARADAPTWRGAGHARPRHHSPLRRRRGWAGGGKADQAVGGHGTPAGPVLLLLKDLIASLYGSRPPSTPDAADVSSILAGDHRRRQAHAGARLREVGVVVVRPQPRLLLQAVGARGRARLQHPLPPARGEECIPAAS